MANTHNMEFLNTPRLTNSKPMPLFCFLLLTFAALLLCAGVSAGADASAGREWAVPVFLTDSDNFFRVTDDVYRSAQPSKAGMRAYEKFGIRTVINLRGFHSDADEAKGTDLTLVRIPVYTWDADEDEVVIETLQAIRGAEKPVLVHCQHGADRTGLVMAAYRIVEQGWSKDEALDELQNGGFGFHSVWKNITEYITEMNVETIRRALR